MRRKLLCASCLAAMTFLPAVAGFADITTWDARYEGNVTPTTPGSVVFSDATTSAFYTSYGPQSSSNGSVLNLHTPVGAAGLYRLDSKQPYPNSSIFILDPNIGFTTEWRARLNSNTLAGEAGAQIQFGPPSPVNGTNAFHVMMTDFDSQVPGYRVRLGGGSSAPYVDVADGYHTFRMTVLGATNGPQANLYIDGALASTIAAAPGSGNGSPQEIRFGDFNGASLADWDLDYLYLYGHGAVAPVVPEPASISAATLLGIACLSRRRNRR